MEGEKTYRICKIRNNKWLHFQESIWKNWKWKHIKRFTNKHTKDKYKKIEIKSEVELERNSIKDKEGILDIVATIDDETIIDIEMQMQNQHNMTERTLFYGSGLYYTGLKRSENYNKNKKVITINILNFNLFKDGPYHEKAELRREYGNILLTDKLELHFIQIPKFIKEGSEKEIKNYINGWFYK